MTTKNPKHHELQRLLRKLARQVPPLRKLLSQIKTPADWRQHEAEIELGIVQCSRKEIDEHVQFAKALGVSGKARHSFAVLKRSLDEAERRIKQSTGLPSAPNFDIKKDRENWPLWCPNCGNAAPTDPVDNWHSTAKGLECVGCGCTQRWSTVERKREWLKKRRQDLGSLFEPWIDMDYNLFRLHLLINDRYLDILLHLDKDEPPRPLRGKGTGRALRELVRQADTRGENDGGTKRKPLNPLDALRAELRSLQKAAVPKLDEPPSTASDIRGRVARLMPKLRDLMDHYGQSQHEAEDTPYGEAPAPKTMGGALREKIRAANSRDDDEHAPPVPPELGAADD